jgi:hypothetical protein
MGRERFPGVEACAGVVAGGIVQEVKEGLFIGVAGQPGMGADVVLPECAQIADLPAFDGFRPGLIARVGSQLVGDGPASDAGTVGLEAEPAMELTGHRTVGGGWVGR